MMRSIPASEGFPAGFLAILGAFLIAAGPGPSAADDDPSTETESEIPPPPVGVAPT